MASSKQPIIKISSKIPMLEENKNRMNFSQVQYYSIFADKESSVNGISRDNMDYLIKYAEDHGYTCFSIGIKSNFLYGQYQQPKIDRIMTCATNSQKYTQMVAKNRERNCTVYIGEGGVPRFSVQVATNIDTCPKFMKIDDHVLQDSVRQRIKNVITQNIDCFRKRNFEVTLRMLAQAFAKYHRMIGTYVLDK